MAGGNILAGSLMLMFVLVITLLVAFLQSQGATTTQDGFQRCDVEGNTTVCESGSTQSFVSAVGDVTVSGIDGAPLIVNGLYLLVMGGLLVLGIVLIVLGILSVAFGGG